MAKWREIDGKRSGVGKYDGLSREELIGLLEKNDRTKKLGLVWERDAIEADKAIDANFVAAALDPALSDKPAPWRNLVIEGDNFDALRWLRMTYAGQIKCIYVDPPYNTGAKDWVYNDHYFDKDDRYRFSTWLEFLYRRFTLARDLLTEDGVILVSINDENRALLELMLDEALPGMKAGTFAWRSRTGGNEGGNHFISGNHEHILIYANSRFKFGGTDKSFEKYEFYDESKKDFYRLSDITQPKDWTERRNGFYAMHDPKTDIYYPANPLRVWPSPYPRNAQSKEEIFTESEMAVWPLPDDKSTRYKGRDQIREFIEQGRIEFPAEQKVAIFETLVDLKAAIARDEIPKAKATPKIWVDMPNLEFWVNKRIGFGIPQWVRYKSELKTPTQPISSWITPTSEMSTISSDQDKNSVLISSTTQEGTAEIQSIFGSKAFPYAKPVSLIRELVRQSSSQGDFVLDFFAGSATTAQAVMELNAEDNGDRRFIMVSSTESTKDEPDKNICHDLTAGRIRRLNASTSAKYDVLAAEFAYLKCRTIKFEDLDIDLKPQEVWSAIEALHDLPLTLYAHDLPWNEHGSDSQTVIYADSVSDALINRIELLLGQRANLFVYVWAPGQLDRFKGRDVEIRSVRSTLVKRFQQ